METEQELLQRLNSGQRAAYQRMMYGGKLKEALPPAPAPQPVQQPSQPAQVAEQPQAVDMSRVKRNIGKMIDQSAPEHEIDAYVASEGVTPEQLQAHKAEPKELSWSDVPGQALSNIPSSAARTAEAIVHPFLHPIDTAKALGGMATGAASKAEGALGMTQDPAKKAEDEAQLNAVGQFFANRYGSMDALKKSLAEDPVGVAADIATVLYGGGATLARGPGVIARAGEAVSKAGSVIDPVANVARAAKGGGKAVSEIVGVQSGVAGQNYRLAFDAGRKGGAINETFRDNMNGSAPATDVLDMARSGVNELKQERSDAYNAGMVHTDASMKRIDYRPVAKIIENAANSVYMGKFAKSQEAADTIKQITDKFEEFHGLDDALKNTARGADVLKQAMGEIRMATKQGTLSRRIADSVYNSIKNEIVKQVPEYAATMKGYSQASDTIDDLSRTFSLGEKASKDTALRKLTSALRNNVNTNFGRREQLMNVLAEKQPGLPYAVAGQTLNDLAPRGLARLAAGGTAGGAVAMSNPAALALLPFASPRLMGETANALGRGYGAVEGIGNALHMDPEMVQNALMASYLMGRVSEPAALVGEQDIGPQTPEELKRRRR